MDTLHKLSEALLSKKGFKTSSLLFLLLILISLFLFRTCSRQSLPHKEVYIIGRNSSWYPLQLQGKEKSLMAFTNDLMLAIGKETELRFQWAESSPNILLEDLDAGIYDAIISSMHATPINQEKHLFSEMFFEIGPVLVVRKDSTAKSLKDMQGRSIGIVSVTSPVFNAVRESGANVYNLLLINYYSDNQVIEALVRNQIDGVILDAFPAYTFVDGFYADKLKVVTAPLSDEGLRLVTLKTESSEILIHDFDIALNKLKENGTYSTLIEKWGLIDPEKDYHDQK